MEINPMQLLLIIIPIVVIFIFAFFHVLREYERAVVFTLGRFWKVKGPGLIILVPFIQQMVRVQLRTVVMPIPEQDIISKDNVSVKVNAAYSPTRANCTRRCSG